jgi:hypothetical protein
MRLKDVLWQVRVHGGGPAERSPPREVSARKNDSTIRRRWTAVDAVRMRRPPGHRAQAAAAPAGAIQWCVPRLSLMLLLASACAAAARPPARPDTAAAAALEPSVIVERERVLFEALRCPDARVCRVTVAGAPSVHGDLWVAVLSTAENVVTRLDAVLGSPNGVRTFGLWSRDLYARDDPPPSAPAPRWLDASGGPALVLELGGDWVVCGLPSEGAACFRLPIERGGERLRARIDADGSLRAEGELDGAAVDARVRAEDAWDAVRPRVEGAPAPLVPLLERLHREDCAGVWSRLGDQDPWTPDACDVSLAASARAGEGWVAVIRTTRSTRPDTERCLRRDAYQYASSADGRAWRLGPIVWRSIDRNFVSDAAPIIAIDASGADGVVRIDVEDEASCCNDDPDPSVSLAQGVALCTAPGTSGTACALIVTAVSRDERSVECPLELLPGGRVRVEVGGETRELSLEEAWSRALPLTGAPTDEARECGPRVR